MPLNKKDLLTQESNFEFQADQKSEAEYMLKTRECNQRMSNPEYYNSKKFWISVLELQDTYKDIVVYTRGNDYLLYEKKLLIIKKAFSACKDLESDVFLRHLYIFCLIISSQKNNDNWFKEVVGAYNNWLIKDDDFIIKDNQHCYLIYDNYITFLINHFSDFNATYLREISNENIEKLNTSLYNNFCSGSSSEEIKKLYEMLLNLVFKTVETELRMGYSQKANGILLGLLMYNLQEMHNLSGDQTDNFEENAFKQFGENWEDYNKLKLGEYDTDQNQSISNNLIFKEMNQEAANSNENSTIFHFEKNATNYLKKFGAVQNFSKVNTFYNESKINFTEGNNEKEYKISINEWITKEISYHYTEWRPSNVTEDSAKIDTNQDSVVFWDDIKNCIFSFDSQELLTRFLNNFFGFNGLPEVFAPYLSINSYSITNNVKRLF